LHVLDTERLTLRWLTAEDADFILELTNDPDWLRFIGDRGIRDADDARAYIATGPVDAYARLGFGLFAVELKETRVPVGICGLVRREWLDGVDLGFAYLPAFRGMGYAHEAAAATVEHARTLGFDRLLAIVSPGNASSVRLLTRLGLTFERMARPAGDGDEVCVFGRALT
jgi:RimJ/RimL family protein N-acetyltransferase